MSIIEMLLVIISVVVLFLFVFKIKNSKKVFYVSSSLLIGVLVIHLIVDFVRWQFYILYIVDLFIITIQFFVVFKDLKFNKIQKKILSISLIILLFTSIFAVLAFPIYEIPKPTGDYLIGTKTYEIEDVSRNELYGDNEYRKYMIQIWYPAETTEGYIQAPWLEGGLELSKSVAKDNYLPSFALNHTTDILSNSYYDAPVNDDLDKYEVIVVSHGWRGFRTLHTDLIEELASQGYIVVSIDHTYGSTATVFEDEVLYLNLDALPANDDHDEFLVGAKKLVNTYSGDIIDTIDYLEELNTIEDSLFYQKIDLETIGLLGHSTGGGAGVDAALKDNRIDAVFGLDSWVEPVGTEALSEGLSIPSVFLRSGAWETGENNDYLYTLIDSSSVEPSLYQIDGTTHYDFAMVYMYSPLIKLIGFSGTVDNQHLTDILKTSIVNFFDESLKDQPQSSNPDDYDEVRVID